MGAALVGEEIFDALQRQILDDPELQPIVRRLMRIHVTEEARHIQFAREGLLRKLAPAMPWYRKVPMANIHGVGGPFYRMLFTLPVYYNRAGLDGRRMRRSARTNPHFRQKCRSPSPRGLVLRGGRADGPAQPSDVAQGRISVSVIVIGAAVPTGLDVAQCVG